MRSRKSEVTVMLDIFSGRPNPQWSLSDAQIGELQGKVKSLPAGKALAASGLGYRGFVVTNVSKDRRLPEQVRAYKGVLAVTLSRKVDYYEDTNHVEEWPLS